MTDHSVGGPESAGDFSPTPKLGDARVRVLVAEDDDLLRAAIGDLVDDVAAFELVGTASDTRTAIQLARALQPDVVLLDVRMPDGGGTRALREIADVSPSTRAIALSAHDDRATVLAMLRAGALGYLVKGGPPHEVLEAIDRAGRGQASLSATLMSDLVSDVSRGEAERSEFDGLLARSDARFTQLLAASPDAVLIIESDGRIMLVNPETLRLFGYERHELLGEAFELLLPDRLRERYRQQLASWSADPWRFELGSGFAGRRKEGTEFPVLASCSVIEDGNARMAAVFVRDLSERQASDALLRKNDKHFETLLDSAPEAVVIVDADGRIGFVNRQSEVLFGYARGELLDRPVELLVPAPLAARHRALGDDYLADPQIRPIEAGLELTGCRKDGSEFPADISFSGVETSEGRLIAAFVRDVSGRKARTDHERVAATRSAVLAHLVSAGEDERRRIAADIHDDSIQVMTAAGMRLQILERSITEPEQLAFLATLQETIALAISRLRHLLFELRPPELDHEGLGPALRTYLEAADTHVGTFYDLDDRLTSQPHEETRVILYRIAQEVLTNARKHASARHVSVTLAGRDAGYQVRVVDDGVGFANGAALHRPGHLGLAAIRERAELAGGWLRVTSVVGTGTTVECWVPAGPSAGRSGSRFDPGAGAQPTS